MMDDFRTLAAASSRSRFVSRARRSASTFDRYFGPNVFPLGASRTQREPWRVTVTWGMVRIFRGSRNLDLELHRLHCLQPLCTNV